MSGRYSRRLYRALLCLYPSAFRREYGPLLLAAFDEMWLAADGWRGRLCLWRFVLADLATSVAVEQADERWRWLMRQQLWLLWIASSVTGWLVAGWFLLPEATLWMIGVGGALVSALHVLLLQRYVAPAGWWRAALPLKAGVWLLPPALFALLPWETLAGPLVVPALAVFVALSAALVGLLEGLALRPLLGAAWRWLPAPAAGLLAAAAAGLALNGTVLPLAANLAAYGRFSFRLSAGIIGPWMADAMGPWLPLLLLATAAGAAAAYGLVTAGVFATLAGRRIDVDVPVLG